MSDLRFVVSADPDLLFRAAAEGFLDPAARTAGPFPTVPYLLALRQGGLRDELIARATALGVPGWFDPPLCVFHELGEWLGRTARTPLHDFERLVLMEQLARTHAPAVFGKLARLDEFVDALDRLVGELAQEGVTADALEAAFAGIAGRHEFEQKRDAELAAVYRAYLAVLASHGCRDGRDERADLARAVTADPTALERRLRGRREIRILGIHDLRGGWRPLLDALRQSPALDRIVLYGADDAPARQLGITAERLDDGACLAARVFDTNARRDGTVALISAPDPEREAEEVARRVRGLVDGGTPLCRIAVVSRKARPRVDLMVDALEGIGLPASARRRLGFDEIPAIRALAALFAAAADRWTRAGLAELAAQPYFHTGLDRRIIDHLGYQRRIVGLQGWAAALAELEAAAQRRAEGDGDGDDRRRWLPSPEWVARAREGFAGFAGRAAVLDRPRPLVEWIAWLRLFLDVDPWDVKARIYAIPDGRYDVLRRDLLGWKTLAAAVGEWHDAVTRWGDDGTALPAHAFHERLRRLLTADAALWTPAHRGVRVLEGLAAAYRTFDHVFLVGVEAGEFPGRRPRSPILNDEERDALIAAGLPLEASTVWDERERVLFRLLVGSARTGLTVSAARMDERGREIVSSSFLEALGDAAAVVPAVIPTGQVRTPGYPAFAGAAAGAQAVHGAAIEHARATGELGPYNGLITDPALVARVAGRLGEAYVWSPTQLEIFAACPWRWFSSRLLRLELHDDPDADMDPATRGTVYHDALKRFYDAAIARVGGPVFLREPDLAWAEPLLREKVAEAMTALGADNWLGHPALRPAKTRHLTETLVKYLRWEVQENEDAYSTSKRKAPARLRTAVEAHELAFDGLRFERGGVAITLRGSIDRVEVGCDERVDGARYVAAVDYKSSEYAAPGFGKNDAWDDDLVLQVPLYAWALTRLRPRAVVSRTEYRALRNRKAVLELQMVQVKGRANAKEIVEVEEEVEKLDRALDVVVRCVRELRAGQYPTRPTPTGGCSSFCPSWDICRVKGGPVDKWSWS
jgi:ATP-dependent helicase/nuclease subunit B